MKEYLIIGGVLAFGWLLITRPMTREELARSKVNRFFKMAMSLAVAGACVWFAWWVLATKCAGGC